MADEEAQAQTGIPPRVWYPLSHTSLYAMLWKGIVSIVAICISWGIPYFMGFADEYSFEWEICDYFLTAFIMVDIIITFSTSYLDQETNEIIVDRDRISRNYGSLAILDIVCIVPYAAFNLLIPYPIVAKTLLFLRLSYVRKAFDGLSILKEVNLRGINITVRWIKLLLVLFLSLNLIGCFFYLMASTNPKIKNTWLSLVEEKSNGLFHYAVAVYWATTMLSTVGYGDLHPVNVREMLFNTGVMIYNVAFFGYITKKVDQLLSTKAKRRVPNAKALIRGVYFFGGVSEALIFQLVSAVDIHTLKTGKYLVQKNEYPGKLYILVHGNVVRNGDAATPTPLKICGELGVFGSLPQPYAVRARAPSTLLSLTKTKFEELLQVNRRDVDKIAANVIQELTQHSGDPALKSFLDQIQTKIDRVEIGVSVIFAVQRPNSRLLRQLIKQGEDLEDVYNDNQTILHMVASEAVKTNEDCFRTLMAHCSNFDKRDSHGKIALNYLIASKKNESILEVFQNKGAVLPSDQVNYLLSTAMDKNDLDILKTARDFMEDINVVLPDGNTPLHLAVREKKRDFVEMLLEWKADPDKLNAEGESAFDWAIVAGIEISRLFTHGVNPNP